MNKEQKLKIPEIGEYVRHVGKLIKVETIQPPPPITHQEYIFEEIEARCELHLHGRVLKSLFTISDFYGLETSVSEAIKEAQKYITNMNISSTSDVEVVVIKLTTYARKVKLQRENFYASEYYDFDWQNDIRQINLPENKEEIVWSSKCTNL